MTTNSLLSSPVGGLTEYVQFTSPWPDVNVTLTLTHTHTHAPHTNGSDSDNNLTSPSILSPNEHETLQMTRFIMYGVLGNVLVVLGLLGNILSIVVLCNHRMRSSTSYYLTSLAVYDNFILLSMLLFFNLPALAYKAPAIRRLHNRYMVLIPMGYPLSLAAQMGSIYTCVAFTIERFIAVCRPLHAANTCTKSRAKRAILLIFLWSIVYNIPRCFYYDAQVVWNNQTGEHETQIHLTSLGQNELFQHIYLIYFQLIFMFLVPFLIISVLNTALLLAIKRSLHQRQEMSVTATREHNLTVMLVAVIAVFLVCQFPTIVDNILVAIVGEVEHTTVLQYQLLYTVCTFLVTINSSLNFMLYCLFGKKFRMVLRHILGLKGSGRRDKYRSTIYQSKASSTKASHLNNSDEMDVSLV
ncbi:FMRFamide receptor-like [Babylonia areolata]|uniref:FMRFamide receptor-like n=1 Tax=Babylonia areolata TaxID=304850 RepID=UPI003FCF4294